MIIFFIGWIVDIWNARKSFSGHMKLVKCGGLIEAIWHWNLGKDAHDRWMAVYEDY